MPLILEDIRSKARARSAMQIRKPRIALGDATDKRILAAAIEAAREDIATIVLIGSDNSLSHIASEFDPSLNGIEIVSAESFPTLDTLAERYFARRAGKIPSVPAATSELISNPLLFGAVLAEIGFVDGIVAGSISTTADVIRAALKGIGLMDGISTLSSMFLLAFPPNAGSWEREFSLAFADAAVMVDPTANELADIAIATANTYEILTGNEPRVAMLSFSTHGSARSDSTEKMIAATALAREKAPTLSIDGELQFDAAFIPEVAERKAKNSSVAGRANVFIFPNLDAGNIAYKIAERLGGAEAIGPILQGLRVPMNDLSRGASISDIVNMIVITVLQGSRA